jgi:hypothetical protein
MIKIKKGINTMHEEKIIPLWLAHDAKVYDILRGVGLVVAHGTYQVYPGTDETYILVEFTTMLNQDQVHEANLSTGSGYRVMYNCLGVMRDTSLDRMGNRFGRTLLPLSCKLEFEKYIDKLSRSIDGEYLMSAGKQTTEQVMEDVCVTYREKPPKYLILIAGSSYLTDSILTSCTDYEKSILTKCLITNIEDKTIGRLIDAATVYNNMLNTVNRNVIKYEIQGNDGVNIDLGILRLMFNVPEELQDDIMTVGSILLKTLCQTIFDS